VNASVINGSTGTPLSTALYHPQHFVIGSERLALAIVPVLLLP
jgi:hypothetical protein